MKIPAGATSFTPKPAPLHSGEFRGSTIRHTFRPAGTPDWLLIYTLSGSGLYRLKDGNWESHSHDITLYQPAAFQEYQIAPAARKWDLLYVHFLARPDWRPWLDWPAITPGLMTLHLVDRTLQRQVVHRWRDVIRLDASSHSRRQQLALNALEEVLLWCDSINPRRSSSLLDPRLGKAMDFLTENLTAPFSQNGLARAAGLSPSRLRQLFHQQTGLSPRQHLEQQRLGRARDLLAMSRSTIGEIALETGFASPFYFSLRFKKEMGESPRAYRRRVASPPGST
jgi:AraC family transcriptional regulator of arabinose operon